MKRKFVFCLSLLIALSLFSISYAGVLDELGNAFRDMSQEKHEEIVKKEEAVKRNPSGMLLTANINGAPLEYVLNQIFSATKEKFFFDHHVDRKARISINVKDEEFDVALRNMLHALDYSFKKERGMYKIQAYEMKTYALPVPPLKQNFKNVITNKAQTGQEGTSTSGSTNTMGSSTGGSSTGGSASSSQSSMSEQGTNSDFEGIYTNLEKDLQKLVKKGWYSINRIGGIVTVYETPSVIALIDEHIGEIKKELSKQVVIEVQVVEVTLNDSNQFGVDWNKVIAWGGRSLTFSTNSLVQGLFGGAAATTLTYKGKNTTGILQALGEQGKVNVLSQPRLLALNNHPAIIQLTTSITYVAGFQTSSTQTANTTGVTTGVVQNGISMYLMPRIDDNGRITLFITPMITELRGMRKETVENAGSIELPTVDQRSFGGTVNMNDGETVVIGGLLKVKDSETKDGVPGLSRIPILGGLFGYQDKKSEMTDLSIIISAKIQK